MADCDHNCDGCPSAGNCGEQKIQKAKMNELSSAKKVIAVLSGKGGVGKSFITSYLAVSLARKGYKVGVLDADVTGPSIPKAFGVTEKAYGENNLIYPLKTKSGIRIMSANCLLDDDSEPIIWRGVLLGNLVKQFYEDVLWGELDYLLIDMPPGTGDIALTTFQTIPIDDLIIVTSPQDLVSLIVSKAIKMADLDEFSKKLDFKVLGKLPIVSENATKVDSGKVEDIQLPEFESITESILEGGQAWANLN